MKKAVLIAGIMLSFCLILRGGGSGAPKDSG